MYEGPQIVVSAKTVVNSSESSMQKSCKIKPRRTSFRGSPLAGPAYS